MYPYTPPVIFLSVCAVLFYFLPTIIGARRGVLHPWLLFFGNLLFGAVFGIGWFVALIYAFAGQRRGEVQMVAFEALPPGYGNGGRRQPPPLNR